jgi:hypothetical protein
VNHGRLKSLEEIFIFSSGVDIGKILVWDVKESLSSSGISSLIKECHELMKIHDKVLFDTIRPVILAKKLLDIFGLHLLKQVGKWVSTDESKLDTFLKV